jgi:hypothetical protein
LCYRRELMDTLKHLKEAYQEVPRDLKNMAKDFLFSAWHTVPKVAPSLAAIGMNQINAAAMLGNAPEALCATVVGLFKKTGSSAAEMTGNAADMTGKAAEMIGKGAELTGKAAGMTGNAAVMTSNAAEMTGKAAEMTGKAAGECSHAWLEACNNDRKQHFNCYTSVGKAVYAVGMAVNMASSYMSAMEAVALTKRLEALEAADKSSNKELVYRGLAALLHGMACDLDTRLRILFGEEKEEDDHGPPAKRRAMNPPQGQGGDDD